jgi:hypothetical protein
MARIRSSHLRYIDLESRVAACQLISMNRTCQLTGRQLRLGIVFKIEGREYEYCSCLRCLCLSML